MHFSLLPKKTIVALLMAGGLQSVSHATGTVDSPAVGEANSIFGPRAKSASKKDFHRGLDAWGQIKFARPMGTPIPALLDGKIDSIRVATGGGHAIQYRPTGSKPTGLRNIGYYHTFENEIAPTEINGFLKKRISFFPPAGLMGPPVVCDVIFVATTRKALVDRPCGHLEGRKITETVGGNKYTFTVTRIVTKGEPISPMGDSQTPGVANPGFGRHLHVYVNDQLDNPLAFLKSGKNESGKNPLDGICARPAGQLAPFACDQATVSSFIAPIRVTAGSLAKWPYISVEVDWTNSLELDEVRFVTSLSWPAPTPFVRYGGRFTQDAATTSNASIVNPKISPKFLDKVHLSTDARCTASAANPASFDWNDNDVHVCVQSWDGEQGSPQPQLRTKFLVPVRGTGVQVGAVTPGMYNLEVRFGDTNTQGAVKTLTFEVEVVEPTLAIDILGGSFGGQWTGVPGTVTLSGLNTKSPSVFQASGTTGCTAPGERGVPLFSNQVTAGAGFFEATSISNMPYYSSGPFINRRPCSSFVAYDWFAPSNSVGKLWANATGRAWLVNGTDWEYQLRFYSGDPANGYADQACFLGVVPNAGFFNGSLVPCKVNCAGTDLGVRLPFCP